MLGRLLAIILLVLLNAFFVGAEFALVRSRRTRLEAMTRSGDRLARIALRASTNISRVLSASQLGVTLASLGLGWVAESTVGDIFATLFNNLPFAIEASVRLTIGATIALIVVTYLHVVFGELTPKAAALNHPEGLARWLAPPLLLFALVTKPSQSVASSRIEVESSIPSGVRTETTPHTGVTSMMAGSTPIFVSIRLASIAHTCSLPFILRPDGC